MACFIKVIRGERGPFAKRENPSGKIAAVDEARRIFPEGPPSQGSAWVVSSAVINEEVVKFVTDLLQRAVRLLFD